MFERKLNSLSPSGCILCELLTGYPLLPGEDEGKNLFDILREQKYLHCVLFAGDQLSCIIELLGMPPQRLLDQSKRAKNFISSKGDYLPLVTACIQIFLLKCYLDSG